MHRAGSYPKTIVIFQDIIIDNHIIIHFEHPVGNVRIQLYMRIPTCRCPKRTPSSKNRTWRWKSRQRFYPALETRPNRPGTDFHYPTPGVWSSSHSTPSSFWREPIAMPSHRIDIYFPSNTGVEKDLGGIWFYRSSGHRSANYRPGNIYRIKARAPKADWQNALRKYRYSCRKIDISM